MEYTIVRQRNRTKKNADFLHDLTSQFGLTTLCADYLISKGIDTIDGAERFLYPSRDHLHDPFLLSDMKKATDRIKKAVVNQESIYIYGDYDCDGICATAVLYKAISSLGGNVKAFIPDRFADGYGMNMTRIEELRDNGAKLIITVDNGITAVDEIRAANRFGIDVIVTDHHTLPPVLPRACAIVNPLIDSYPDKDICGTAVDFKVCEALDVDDSLFSELMAFTAIATVADMVPLTGENRTFVSLGLKEIAKEPNEGLDALITKAGLSALRLTASNISYQIAPRINASGRMINAGEALELFLSNDRTVVNTIVDELDLVNEERKAIEETIIDQAEQYLKKNNLYDEKILFVCLEDAHVGVVGLAAGTLAEKYNRPAVVGSLSKGEIRASARSVEAFDIYEALSAAGSMYTKFGGHPQAAGFTIDAEKFGAMKAKVLEKAENMGVDSALMRRVYYDFEAVSYMLTDKSIAELEAFAPYGIGNPRPVLKFVGAKIKNVSFMGATKKHVRCSILKGNGVFPAVAFNMASYFDEEALTNSVFDVVFVPSINTYNGRSSMQLEIKYLSQTVPCPEEYYLSLYEAFVTEGGAAFEMKENMMVNAVPEYFIDNTKEPMLFIVHGRDMLERIIGYACLREKKTAIAYGNEVPYVPDAVNVLVNPMRPIIAEDFKHVVVCDKPCFSAYQQRIFGLRRDLYFLDEGSYLPNVLVDREYIAYIYRKLPMLENLGGDIKLFIEHLNTDSPIYVNYFLIRVCFDILSELSIIDYVIDSGKLTVTYRKVEVKKDVRSSSVFQKLMKAYE